MKTVSVLDKKWNHSRPASLESVVCWVSCNV